MKILAIDPGNIESGWCLYDSDEHWVEQSGKDKNEDIIRIVNGFKYNFMAVEMIASYGMPVGADVFETCVWIGRFIGALPVLMPYAKIYRKDVKMFLCHSMRAKDGNIRQAIIDLFPATGGGKIPQIGIKKQPGPLFGISGDMWAAVGVALYAAEGLKKNYTG